MTKAAPPATAREDLELLPDPDHNLSVEEVKLLWSFLHGDIMIGGIRQRLREHWGLCPRHSWAHAVVEIELWQAGAGQRAGHQPFEIGILYEDLLDTMIRKLTDSRPRSRMSVLTPRGICPICRDLRGPTIPGIGGGGYAGSDSAALTIEANQMIHMRLWAAGTRTLWHVCPSCAGTPNDVNGVLCRPHILQRGSLTNEDARTLVDKLSDTRDLLVPLVESMTQSGRPSTGTADASWIQALGWFHGWNLPLALASLDAESQP
ncbi:hypothetical protein [Cryobacterium sp. MDB2-33-2]|uniref:hypothetical protein n=1 Tax=Cryobacterium sp. MDB2-33-2 TaxID=1259179 RepID=UPI0010693309|nr:hypothetical protein [Cryobacterium sp. MDB2-33-2]TFC03348.1 hypothetical protein E3O59_15810 [Cryobacterium sp. MDB2-33-2]